MKQKKNKYYFQTVKVGGVGPVAQSVWRLRYGMDGPMIQSP